jgi:hypothetical protein
MDEMDETTAAAISAEQDGATARIELYDSGATRHISPYKDGFSTYSTNIKRRPMDSEACLIR